MSLPVNGVGHSRQRNAFTLVELMVSMSVIALVMVILLSTVGQTQRIWVRSTNKISQFQSARAAFDALTRNLSQATLNTYYGVSYDPKGNPEGYFRESELHFVSGKAAQAKLLGSGDGSEFKYPTHALFFQAPLGMTARADTAGNKKLFGNLSHLLSGVGYYIEWGEDKNLPDFLKQTESGDSSDTGTIPKRYRSRLMEVIQPAEMLSIYATKDYYKSSPFAKTTDWIQVALGNKAPASGGSAKSSAWVRAENIIALVVLPKHPEKDGSTSGTAGNSRGELAPAYEFDSRPADGNGTPVRIETIKSDTYSNKEHAQQINQLPPIVQVVMVAIDEPSAARYQDINGQKAPEWTKDLFQNASELENDLGDPAKPTADSLINRLGYSRNGDAPRMDYRIYTAEVVIRGAKWSAIDY